MRQTNAVFAKENRQFQDACQKVGIPATARQASKYRAGKGKARMQIA